MDNKCNSFIFKKPGKPERGFVFIKAAYNKGNSTFEFFSDESSITFSVYYYSSREEFTPRIYLLNVPYKNPALTIYID